jgi:glycosyltransferase involved in cell wall biosynthesis
MTRLAWYVVVLRAAMDSSNALAPDPRGYGRYARDLTAALRRRADLELTELDGADWRGPAVSWEQIGLPRALRRGGHEVVHTPHPFLPLRRPCAGVVTIHDLSWEVFPGDFTPRTRTKFKLFAPRAARSAERVVCVSAYTRDDVCERYGVDPARVRVVHNGPSLEIGTAPPPDGGPYLLGVGDLRVKKNWGRLVRAWLALRGGGLEHRLVIAGSDAGERAALRATGGDAPLELPGYVPDADLDALMRGAAALVHPSLHEGFGLVVVEAMARGVPVAAAKGSALPEAGGDAAVYFDPLDEDAIAAAISEALARSAELSALGRARAAELSWDRAAAGMVEVYAEAAAER